MSNEVLTGTVVKAVGGVFTVKSDRGRFLCFSPKKLRYRSFDVTVGDKVEFCDLGRGKGVILQVLPRKNLLMRPEVANVDVCLLVLASVPKPDLYLADKVLVNCFRQGIEPVIVVNKMDIDDGTAAEIAKNYDTICDIVTLSAINGEGCEALESICEENGVLCGAVGGGQDLHTQRIAAWACPKNGRHISKERQRHAHHEAYVAARGFWRTYCRHLRLFPVRRRRGRGKFAAVSGRLYEVCALMQVFFLYAHRRAGLRRKAGCAEGRYLQGKVREVRRGVQRTFTGGKTQILR